MQRLSRPLLHLLMLRRITVAKVASVAGGAQPRQAGRVLPRAPDKSLRGIVGKRELGEDLGMANPWDPLPLPRDADLDDKVTYEWVGRIVDRWEQIEFTLARLHSVFVGDPRWKC